MATARAELHTDASPLAGIAFMCAGVFFLTVNDVFAKWMGMYYPVPEVAFLRMLFALPMIVAAGLMFGGPRALATRRLPAQLGRGLLATLATLTFYLSLTLLPLAEATAIAFTAPLFVTMLAIPLLGERPGRTQWLVTCIGFIGVLLIVRPGGAAFTLAALAPLGTAMAYALLMLSARMLGRGETIWATMFYATVVPLVITAAIVPWFWATPSLEHLPHFVALGFSGGLALTLITQGFRIGVASVVAPFDYTGLVWATCFGWLLWGEIPSSLSILGGLIIGACGVYLAYSQARRARRQRAADSLHPPRGD
ncbi:MAG TPA: DMT family transporter [Arenicellales bacterium]|nr:DMT family transporter [Arenicellales bacterium]